MSEARVNNLSNESNTGGPTISGITTFSGTNFFVPPVGNTAQRPENPQKGSLRFNTDTKHLEYYKGDTIGWSEIEASNHELGGGTGSNTGYGTRALFQGGLNPALSPTRRETVDYITISTLGTAEDFGDLVVGREWCTAGCSSRTRAICAGGYTHPTITAEIDYVTISAKGDYADFGDLFDSRVAAASASSATRGLFCGGNPANNSTKTNGAEYITIASAGSGKDFGDIATATASLGGNIQSSTRALFYGGYTPTRVKTIDAFTTATLGDAIDFGDLTTGGGNVPAGFSNATRGVRAGGNTTSSPYPAQNVIDFVTIASTGNATDFGDLINATSATAGGASSPTRGVIAGTDKSPSPHGNVIEYVEIVTTGNSVQFGNLSENRSHACGVSNGHGGL